MDLLDPVYFYATVPRLTTLIGFAMPIPDTIKVLRDRTRLMEASFCNLSGRQSYPSGVGDGSNPCKTGIGLGGRSYYYNACKFIIINACYEKALSHIMLINGLASAGSVSVNTLGSYDGQDENDAVYKIDLQFTIPSRYSMEFRISGELLSTTGYEPIEAESWGIDNVELYYAEPVPAQSSSAVPSTTAVAMLTIGDSKKRGMCVLCCNRVPCPCLSQVQ